MIKEHQVSPSPKTGFPIPNLLPLLQCFNVPEPIIHPPGVDPYTFLIPKHCDQEMEMIQMISPMDIDPCVMLRSESVARTCDLTQSEHAGVSLSEPSPMVSTTSHSLARSKVSTLTTVNNTQIPTETDTLIFCEACKVTCVDENAYKRHKEGKKHLKNTQTHTVVSTTSHSSAHTKVTTQPAVNNVVVTQIPMETDTFIFCEACKVTCIDDNAFKRHTEGKTHLKNIQTLPNVSTTISAHSEVTTQPNVNDVVATEIQTEKGTFIFCGICKVTCLSEKAFKRHKEGKTHLKNTQPLPIVSSTSNSPGHSEVSAQPNNMIVTQIQRENEPIVFCDACDVTCVGENAFKRHNEGKTHLKNTHTLLVVSSASSSPAHSKVTAQPKVNNVVVTQIQPDKETELKNTQTLPVSSNIIQETPLPVANDTLDQDPENNKDQNSLQKEELVVDSLFVCSIPDLGIHYQRIVTQDLVNGGLCMDPTLMSKTNGGTQNGHEKLSVSQAMWCKICKVSCSSDKCLERHISGKQHIKNLKLLEQNLASQPITTVTSMDITPMNKPVEDLKSIKCETVDMDETKPTWCELCKVICTSNDINRHLTGKKHLKNLQKQGKIPDMPLTPSPLVSMTKGEVVNPKEGNSKQCELCGICCTSSEELIKHISGKKHQKILKNSQKLYGHTPTPEAKRTLQDFMNEDIEEGEIVIEERSKRKANGSLASDEDIDTKRQKVMEQEIESGELVTCQVCNVACKGLMAFKCHLGSFEHSSMVMKQIHWGSSKQ